MHSSTPIDARVRLAIVQWPDDAPRGAVTTFCAEHGLSRKSFYTIRQQAVEDGPTAALPGRVTPAQAYAATPIAEPPRPAITNPLVTPGKSIAPREATPARIATRTRGDIGKAGRLVSSRGLVSVQGTNYNLGNQLGGLEVWVVQEEESISFFMTTGDHLISYPATEPGTRYLGKQHALEISPHLNRVSPMS